MRRENYSIVRELTTHTSVVLNHHHMTDALKKIVVLDGHTLNPGDLSWNNLAALGDLTVHDRTPPEEVTERAGTAEIVFTNKALLSDEAINALPALEYIGVLATGYNVVEIEAALRKLELEGLFL